jgi:thiamine biosynthesis protein ThiI
MRRGASPVFIHFHSYPYTEKSSQETARRLARLLLRGQPPAPFWLVPLGEIQQQIISDAPADLRVLLYRRFMFRLAAQIARREHAAALVTGEALGQVASQTIENMGAVEACVDLPVLRPLLGFDKREIVEAARSIGTFETRSAGHDDCCSYLIPPHPATKATAEELAAAEESLPVERIMGDALDQAERTTLAGLSGTQ